MTENFQNDHIFATKNGSRWELTCQQCEYASLLIMAVFDDQEIYITSPPPHMQIIENGTCVANEWLLVFAKIPHRAVYECKRKK